MYLCSANNNVGIFFKKHFSRIWHSPLCNKSDSSLLPRHISFEKNKQVIGDVVNMNI